MTFRLTRPPGLIAGALLLAFCGHSQAQAPAGGKLPEDHAERMVASTALFKSSVRKILTERCLNCHGGEKVRGDFDLSSRETLLKSDPPGAAVVPYDRKRSKLFLVVSHQEKPFMPHKADKLPDREIEALGKWIDLGAAYDQPLVAKSTSGKQPMVVTEKDRRYWAFEPLGSGGPPAVKDAGWCRTALDRFVLASLESKGLAPASPAARRQLIRRVTFDLIGLPPTPAEIDAFLTDQAPDAYDRLVERLLDNPHFGEKWARHWLDIARFAESSGYEHDYDRPFAYHYRDFVIKAFNQDLPYNTFVRWQLAGDEYEPANPLAMMATGFLAAGTHSTQITKNLVEKERYEQLDDKLRTMGTAMLGLTIGCARCHDHKYDPIPTRDYYRLLSVFGTTVKSNVDIDVDPAGYARARAAWEKEHQVIVERLKSFERDVAPGRFAAWLESISRPVPQPTWVLLEPGVPRSAGGATMTPLEDGSVLVSGKEVDFDTYTFTLKTGVQEIRALRLEAMAEPGLPRGGPGRAGNGNFALSDLRLLVKQAGADKAVPVRLVRARATFEQKGLPAAGAIDSDPKSAWAVDGAIGKDSAAVFELDAPLNPGPGAVLTVTLAFSNNAKHGLGRLRLAISSLAGQPDFKAPALPERVWRAMNASEPGKTEKAELLRWFKNVDVQWQAALEAVKEHDRLAPRPNLVKALIASEGVPPLRMHTQGADFFEKTFILKRGDVDQKEAVATPSYLQVLMRHADGEKHWQTPPPPGCKTSYRRHALAEWITDTESGAGNLLARVIVNRLWQHHLGRGIVGTPGDFGLQGEPPSNPELLDFLARELIRNGWRLKPIHRLIVTSAVYLQDSAVQNKNFEIDPENRLFWHRPRQRLDAELIRDAMLAVSGSLDERPFGPGTLEVSQKRRSIYYFVKRSKLVPSMVLFDAPDALAGIDRRPRTTVAPQALWIMNAAEVRGYAEAFARRLSAASEWRQVVEKAYLLALGRAPHEKETQASVQFLHDQAAEYAADGRPNPRELATADFCQAVLALNEFVFID